MTKDHLKNRVLEIEAAVQQSLANHNGLLGQLAEARHWLAEAEKSVDCVESCVEAVEAAPAEEAAA